MSAANNSTERTWTTAAEEEDGPMDGPMPEAYIVPAFFTLIFIVGLVGNGSLIFIVARHKKLRNTPNVLIVSLAVGDLLLIAFCVPFMSLVFTVDTFPFGLAMCKVREFVRTMSMGVSIFTLTALSGERFVAIVYPMSLHKGSAKTRTLLIAGVIWLLSLALATLDAVSSELQWKGNDTVLVCSVTPARWGDQYLVFYVVYQFVVFFALPVVIITIFYVLMARMLWMSGRMVPGMQPNQGSAARQTEARKKVAKLVLAFVVIFVVCWLPRHVYQLWFHLYDGNYSMFWHVMKIGGFILSFFNSCVNPIALYFLSKQFRQYFNHHLFCCCCSRSSPGAVENSQTTKVYNFQSYKKHGVSGSLMTSDHTSV